MRAHTQAKAIFLATLMVLMVQVGFIEQFNSISSESNPSTLLPKSLQKGDVVELISPSAATADRMQFTFAKEALEALGFQVKLGENLKNRRGHLAGTDQERASDLNQMFLPIYAQNHILNSE